MGFFRGSMQIELRAESVGSEACRPYFEKVELEKLWGPRPRPAGRARKKALALEAAAMAGEAAAVAGEAAIRSGKKLSG